MFVFYISFEVAHLSGGMDGILWLWGERFWWCCINEGKRRHGWKQRTRREHYWFWLFSFVPACLPGAAAKKAT